MEVLRPKRLQLSVEMTPLIDVVFQLLVFFMLSSSMLAPMMRLTLPKASTADDPQNQRLIVSVDEEGAVFVNSESVTLAALQALIQKRLTDDKDKAVFIRGDEAMPYKLFVDIMDASRQAGARHVNILHQGGE